MRGDAAMGRVILRPVSPGRASDRAFLRASALLFAASVAATVAWCGPMSAMGGMAMPGGWTRSMAWVRAPGQTWAGLAVSFLGMWVVMTAAMMLPSLLPTLGRYRWAVGRAGGARVNRLTALVGAGYAAVWTAIGAALFPLGVAAVAVLTARPALARAAPTAAGIVVALAGLFQFTVWKARQLARCREAPGRGGPLFADSGTAWRHGVRLGLRCGQSCANLTAVLVVLGVTELRVMAVLGAAITVERLGPGDGRAARAVGAVLVVTGALLIARAAGLG